jgi:ribosomal-protein-alanine N-acetyltransferase
MLEGPRVRLRPWRDEDLPAVAAMNGDPEVMRWFVKPLSRAESDEWSARMRAHFEKHGWGFWIVDLPGEADTVGVVGLQHASFESWFTPAVEIGWRTARGFQRRGLAEEAARLALAHGFGPAGLKEIVCWIVPGNTASEALARKLGFAPHGDFEHPRLPEGHPYRRQNLFRMTREDWIDQRLG